MSTRHRSQDYLPRHARRLTGNTSFEPFFVFETMTSFETFFQGILEFFLYRALGECKTLLAKKVAVL